MLLLFGILNMTEKKTSKKKIQKEKKHCASSAGEFKGHYSKYFTYTFQTTIISWFVIILYRKFFSISINLFIEKNFLVLLFSIVALSTEACLSPVREYQTALSSSALISPIWVSVTQITATWVMSVFVAIYWDAYSWQCLTKTSVQIETLLC